MAYEHEAQAAPRGPLTIGLILVAAGMFSLDSLDPMTDRDALWPRLALLGLGFGLELTAVPTAAVASCRACIDR